LDSNAQAFATSGSARWILTAEEFWSDTGRTLYDSKTSAPSAPTICPPSTSSAADFPARTSATPESALVLRASDLDCGANTPVLLANYDRDSSSWKTSQLCFTGDLQEFWETWPRSGMTRNGIAYELLTLVPLTSAHESGYWPTPDTVSAEHPGMVKTRGGQIHLPQAVNMWPTPNVPNGGRALPAGTSPTGITPDGKKRQVGLENAVKMWPTPTAEDSQCKGNQSGRDRFTACGGEVVSNTAHDGARRRQQFTEGSEGAGYVADADGAGFKERRRPVAVGAAQSRPEYAGEICDASSERFPLATGQSRSLERPESLTEFKRSDWWAVEPNVGRVAHGVPARVDRLRGLGNAIVPQIAEFIGRRIVEAEKVASRL
jgi:hypothetical protein